MTEDEFAALYDRAYARLVGQVYAVTGDLAEAQDVVQEAFVRAWDRRRALGDVAQPEAWVRTVAVRLAVSRWRSARSAMAAWRRRGVPDDLDGPSLVRPAVVAALQRLPEAQRVAVVLHHLCDLSVDEVARETGAPVGTVKARLSRGRAALRPLLDDARPAPTSEAARA